jgi:TrmH family RNA methyltransferase
MNITSTSNPRVKSLLRLRERRERDETRKFLIEGYRELFRAQEKEWPIEELYYCPEFFLGTNEKALLKSLEEKSVQFFLCSKPVFEKISYRDRPDGLLAVAQQKRFFLEDLEKEPCLKKNPFFLVAESIEKPGNLGTILRSSDAAGVDGIILCDACTDIFNPNVVRSSVGTLFTQKIFEAKKEELLSFLQKKKIRILAATPHAEKNFWQTDLTGAIALLVGTEQYGLSDLWMEHCDLKVKIPMKGTADSLNVASATTVLLYEILRQRTFS